MHRVAAWTHGVAACHTYGCRRGLCSLLATHLPGRSPDECGDRLERLHVQMAAGAAARGSVCFCGSDRHLDGSRIPFDGSWVQCDGCRLWCHRQCAGLKQTKAACDNVECACSLLRTYYSLLTTHYSLLITHYVLLTYHLPLTPYPLPLTPYPLPLTPYPLPLTTYHLPLATQVRMPRVQCTRGEHDEAVPPQRHTRGGQGGGPLRHSGVHAARLPSGEP